MLSSLTQLLNSKEQQTRSRGVCLLHRFAQECDNTAFEENACMWVRLLMQTVNSLPSDNLLAVCFSTLNVVVKRSLGNEKLARDISHHSIEPLIALLMNANISVLPESFELLRLCMEFYPGPCGKLHSEISRFILTALASSSLSSCAASCYPFVPLLGSGGERKSKHIERFELTVKRLLKTIHDLIVLLKNKTDGKESKPQESQIEAIHLPNIPLETVSNVLVTLDRFLLLLEEFLKKSFKSNWPINHLIVTFVNLSETNDPSITAHLLRCISYSLQQFSFALLLYADLILKLVETGLKHATCRTATFQCLGMIVTKWPGIAGKHEIVNEFISHTINTMSLYEKHDVLQPEVKQGKKSKKLSKQLMDDLNRAASNVVHPYAERQQQQTAYAGLAFLSVVVSNCGSLLSVKSLNEILSYVAIISGMYGQHSPPECAPYTNPHLRVKLFKLVNTLLKLHHSGVQVPRNWILNLLCVGSQDCSSLVAHYCRTSLSECDALIHCVAPALLTKKFRLSDHTNDDENETPTTMETAFSLTPSYLHTPSTPTHLLTPSSVAQTQHSSSLTTIDVDRLNAGGANHQQNSVPRQPSFNSKIVISPQQQQHTFDQARLATVTPTRPVTVDDQSPNKDDEVVVLDSSEEESVVTSQKQQRKRPRDNQTQQQKQWGDFALPQKKVATVEIDDTDDILSTFCEE